MSYNLYNMIVYGYSLIKCKPKNKVYLIKRMSATAAASNTPDASSSATSSGSNLVKNHRYARTLEPRSKLTNPLTNVNVYVYKKNEDILGTIDQFTEHLFAAVNTNKTPPETTVYTQEDFKAFFNKQPVVPISHSSISNDDVATTVAIAAAAATTTPTVETAPPHKPSGLKTASLEGNTDFIPNSNNPNPPS